MQSQSNTNGLDQNSSDNSKRIPYIVGGACIFGIIGYYFYNYLQQISSGKNQENEIFKQNAIKQPHLNSQSNSKPSQSLSNTKRQSQSHSKSKPQPKSQPNGIIVKQNSYIKF